MLWHKESITYITVPQPYLPKASYPMNDEYAIADTSYVIHVFTSLYQPNKFYYVCTLFNILPCYT